MGKSLNRPVKHVHNSRVYVRITVGLILVLAIASAVAIYFQQEDQMLRISQNYKTLASGLDEANARQAELRELQDLVDTDEYIERIARDKLGMVKPNEIIFED